MAHIEERKVIDFIVENEDIDEVAAEDNPVDNNP